VLKPIVFTKQYYIRSMHPHNQNYRLSSNDRIPSGLLIEWIGWGMDS